ncbi:MAG: hypothetical protein D6B25_05475 [Desulfobulbaceae bacterium]|nr:MAG: hypothetical protein D6B25_05475 [Desulfobulbaceae bacterium]
MKITNEEHAQQIIEEWRGFSHDSQVRNIKEALEDQELSRMYYESKDNTRGVTRSDNIIALLQKRLTEIDAKR